MLFGTLITDLNTNTTPVVKSTTSQNLKAHTYYQSRDHSFKG